MFGLFLSSSSSRLKSSSINTQPYEQKTVFTKWPLIIFLFALLLFFSISLIDFRPSWRVYKQKTLNYQKKIPGWCCKDKAERMMDLIFETKAQVCIEIGVYAGSSVYPTAAALAYQKKGLIYAIDPWSKDFCVQGYDLQDPNLLWWKEVNFEHIYQNFIKRLERKRLLNFCRVMRMPSYQAADFFEDESVDILHIDGNHSEESSFLDVKTFLPKLKKGGYIWFDDSNWASTKKAVHYLMQFCSLDVEKSIGNSCCLFKKN